MFRHKLFNIALIIMISLSLLVTVTFFLWQMFMKSSLTPAEAKNPNALSAEEILERSVETEEILTNLYGDGYIKVKFRITGDSPETKEELEKRMFQVNHIIIKTLSSLTKDDIKGAKGLAAMEMKIKNEINRVMQNGKIVQVITVDRIFQ
ncbi:flagellar basal body-associated protein FliL [Bacillaceae bacterium]